MRGKQLGFFVLLLVLGSCRRASEEPSTRERLLVMVQPATRGPVEQVVELVGTVEPRRQTTVLAPVAGWVAAYTVREGDRVGKDAVVARIGREVPGLTFRELPVKAPIAGTVLSLLTPEGAEVGPGTPLMVIGDLSELQIRVGVPSELFHRIRVGMAARVRGPGRGTIQATVARRAPAVDPLTGMGQVLLYPSASLPWAPGTAVEVEVILAHVVEALRVPREALIQKDGQDLVFVVENGVAHRRVVQTGLWGRNWVEVRDGLREGEMVVTLGARGLEDGQPVEVRR